MGQRLSLLSVLNTKFISSVLKLNEKGTREGK